MTTLAATYTHPEYGYLVISLYLTQKGECRLSEIRSPDNFWTFRFMKGEYRPYKQFANSDEAWVFEFANSGTMRSLMVQECKDVMRRAERAMTALMSRPKEGK